MRHHSWRLMNDKDPGALRDGVAVIRGPQSNFESTLRISEITWNNSHWLLLLFSYSKYIATH